MHAIFKKREGPKHEVLRQWLQGARGKAVVTTDDNFPSLTRGQRQLCEQLIGPVPLGFSEGGCAAWGQKMVKRLVLPGACNICPPSLRFQNSLGNLHPSPPPASFQPARAGKALILTACQGQEAPLGGIPPSQRWPASRLWKTGRSEKKSLEFYKVVTAVGLHVIKPKCHFPPAALR